VTLSISPCVPPGGDGGLVVKAPSHKRESMAKYMKKARERGKPW
jgi:hypothetical protein